ncbi:MAG: hypothetical protein H7Z75_12840 [Ferruginibacter sp.]|nr:hypothetical protein [Cytophagales bacterium]
MAEWKVAAPERRKGGPDTQRKGTGLKPAWVALVLVSAVLAQDSAAMKNEARALFSRKATDSRVGEILTRVIVAAPEDAEAHHLYGQWALVNHQDELSLRMERRALELTSPDNHPARMQIHTLLGLALDQLERPEDAEAALRRALSENEKLPKPDPGSAFELVKLLERESKTADADKVVSRILAWAPEYGPGHLARARHLLGMRKDYRSAIAAAEKALQLAGSDKAQQRAAHAFLAKTYFAAKNPEAAERHRAALSQ